MNVGIIGLHGSGKTTIYNSLTGQMVHSDSSGGKKGCTLGRIQVPDKRLDKLSSIFNPKKTVYAQVLFADFPGSVQDEKGLGDQTLRKLNDMDALALVLKGFSFGILPTPLEDLKNSVAIEINKIIAPIRKHFEKKKMLLDVFKNTGITR